MGSSGNGQWRRIRCQLELIAPFTSEGKLDMQSLSKTLARRPGRCACALSLLLLIGCSGSGEEGLYPVSGRVLHQGQPVAGAMISFVGEEGTRPATAVSQSDGTYSLFTLDSPGAGPGKYTVVVVKMAETARDDAVNVDLGVNQAGEDLSMQQAALVASKPPAKPAGVLPAAYSNPMTSPLRAEVKQGTANEIDLQLE
jgi:hypothetical protein